MSTDPRTDEEKRQILIDQIEKEKAETIARSGPVLTRTPPQPAPDTKPGWHTSEFWLTSLVIVGVFASLILGRITVNDIANLWPLFTGPAAYALSRGLAKKG